MQTEIKNMYYVEDLEDNEEYLRKQETIKEMLYSILIQPETIETWKTDYKIEIKPELVKVLKIDVEAENGPESEDDPESENYTVIDKEILFVAKLNEGEPEQICCECGTEFGIQFKRVVSIQYDMGKFNNIQEFKYLKRYCPNYLIM